MKSLAPLLFVCFCTGALAQEFRTHENGLMYSAADMKQLRYMVDSLNLRFKKCDLSKPFHSFPQAWMYEVRFSSKNDSLTSIKRDIQNNISYSELIKRYGKFITATDTSLCIFTGKDDKGRDEYLYGNANDGYDRAWFSDQQVSAGKWVYDYNAKGQYASAYTLTAAYCAEEFKQQQLPVDYAAHIQYVDCMVDTSTSIYLSTAEPGYAYDDPKSYSSDKKKRLEQMRNRIVVGYCSQDEGPRKHALGIAVLAAETHSWDIFMRAHLDIMNDRFQRNSDGSYAWNQRQTYLKELEELNLDIIDLMIGLTLRSENTASNHYYGTVWRIGWALTESKDKKIFEAKALKMMKDPRLDEFNRGLMLLLYRSYTERLKDKKEQVAIIRNIKADVKSFPLSLQKAITLWQEPKN